MTTNPTPEAMKAALEGLMRLIPATEGAVPDMGAPAGARLPASVDKQANHVVLAKPYPAIGDTHVRVVKVLPKNNGENLVVSLQDFRGERWIDVRNYALVDGASVPTKEGVKLRPNFGRSLGEAVLDAVRQADEEVAAARGEPVRPPRRF